MSCETPLLHLLPFLGQIPQQRFDVLENDDGRFDRVEATAEILEPERNILDVRKLYLRAGAQQCDDGRIMRGGEVFYQSDVEQIFQLGRHARISVGKLGDELVALFHAFERGYAPIQFDAHRNNPWE